jgi:hypothetical protein
MPKGVYTPGVLRTEDGCSSLSREDHAFRLEMKMVGRVAFTRASASNSPAAGRRSSPARHFCEASYGSKCRSRPADNTQKWPMLWALSTFSAAVCKFVAPPGGLFLAGRARAPAQLATPTIDAPAWSPQPRQHCEPRWRGPRFSAGPSCASRGAKFRGQSRRWISACVLHPRSLGRSPLLRNGSSATIHWIVRLFRGCCG